MAVPLICLTSTLKGSRRGKHKAGNCEATSGQAAAAGNSIKCRDQGVCACAFIGVCWWAISRYQIYPCLRRVIAALSGILLEALCEADEARNGVSQSILAYFCDSAYDLAVRRWLGENLMRQLLEVLLNRSNFDIPDLGLHRSALDLFKVCCAQTPENQVILAKCLLEELNAGAKSTAFLSRMTTFVLTLEDVAPVCLFDDSLNVQVQNMIFWRWPSHFGSLIG